MFVPCLLPAGTGLMSIRPEPFIFPFKKKVHVFLKALNLLLSQGYKNSIGNK
jgi:hypothetical protein